MVDCHYKQPYTAELNPPAVIVSNDTMTNLIEWFVTHLIRNQAAQGNVAAHFIMDG